MEVAPLLPNAGCDSVLIFSDSKNGADMRHAVGAVVSDPFLYIEHDGQRYAVVTGFEVPRLTDAGIEARALEEFGRDEYSARGLPRPQAFLEVLTRACQSLGVERAIVPPTFPLELAERLRSAGVRLTVDREFFDSRRRAKTPVQLEGIRKSQRAAEAAMRAARGILRDARSDGGKLYFGDERVTSELLKEAIKEAYEQHGVLAEDIIAAHGAQIYGHHPGSGPIAPGEPVVLDLAPRDPDSGCFADMTRTFVVGDIDEEIATYHRLVREALKRASEAIGVGLATQGPYEVVCDFFEAQGFDTERTKQPGTFLRSGFFHGLGHGVCLEVHERPFLHLSTDVFVSGDVVTLEPGLYRDGYGGCRLEDLVRVTEEGLELLTTFPYELVP
jgi:Xaa-Pro aminopeptidase